MFIRLPFDNESKISSLPLFKLQSKKEKKK
jgi:hypothetical protein